MQEQLSLMFTWDPRVRRWVNERGEDDAQRPPAEPIDVDALQTYYLDPETDQWTGTILGDRARQISTELGGNYRSAAVIGLAMQPKPKPSKVDLVPTPDQRKRISMLAWLVGIIAAIAIGAYAAMGTLPLQ